MPAFRAPQTLFADLRELVHVFDSLGDSSNLEQSLESLEEERADVTQPEGVLQHWAPEAARQRVSPAPGAKRRGLRGIFRRRVDALYVATRLALQAIALAKGRPAGVHREDLRETASRLADLLIHCGICNTPEKDPPLLCPESPVAAQETTPDQELRLAASCLTSHSPLIRAAVYHWSRELLGPASFKVATVPFVAFAGNTHGGCVLYMTLSEIGLPANGLILGPGQALRPCKESFLRGMATAWEAGGSDRAVAWSLHPAEAAYPMAWPLAGQSATAAAAIGLRSLRDGFPIDRGLVASAGLRQSHDGGFELEWIREAPAKFDGLGRDMKLIVAGARELGAADAAAMQQLLGDRLCLVADFDTCLGLVRGEAVRLHKHLESLIEGPRRTTGKPAWLGGHTADELFEKPYFIVQETTVSLSAAPSKGNTPNAGGRPPGTNGKACPWDTLLTELRNREGLRMAILAPAGHGKTTAAMMAAAELAKDGIAQLNRQPGPEGAPLPLAKVTLPIIIPLAKMPGDEKVTPLARIHSLLASRLMAGYGWTHQEAEAMARYQVRALDDSRTVAFLEGLDEIPEGAAAELLTALQGKPCKLVLTSRPYQYNERTRALFLARASQYSEYRIANLYPSQQSALIQKYFTGAPDGQKKIEELQQALANDSLAAVGASPFLLSILCYLRWSHPPGLRLTSRAKLYEKLMETTLLRDREGREREVPLLQLKLAHLARATWRFYQQAPALPLLEESAFCRALGNADWRFEIGTSEDALPRTFWNQLLGQRLLAKAGGESGMFTFMHKSLAEYLIGAYLRDLLLREETSDPLGQTVRVTTYPRLRQDNDGPDWKPDSEQQQRPISLRRFLTGPALFHPEFEQPLLFLAELLKQSPGGLPVLRAWEEALIQAFAGFGIRSLPINAWPPRALRVACQIFPKFSDLAARWLEENADDERTEPLLQELAPLAADQATAMSRVLQQLLAVKPHLWSSHAFHRLLAALKDNEQAWEEMFRVLFRLDCGYAHSGTVAAMLALFSKEHPKLRARLLGLIESRTEWQAAAQLYHPDLAVEERTSLWVHYDQIRGFFAVYTAMAGSEPSEIIAPLMAMVDDPEFSQAGRLLVVPLLAALSSESEQCRARARNLIQSNDLEYWQLYNSARAWSAAAGPDQASKLLEIMEDSSAPVPFRMGLAGGLARLVSRHPEYLHALLPMIQKPQRQYDRYHLLLAADLFRALPNNQAIIRVILEILDDGDCPGELKQELASLASWQAPENPELKQALARLLQKVGEKPRLACVFAFDAATHLGHDPEVRRLVLRVAESPELQPSMQAMLIWSLAKHAEEAQVRDAVLRLLDRREVYPYFRGLVVRALGPAALGDHRLRQVLANHLLGARDDFDENAALQILLQEFDRPELYLGDLQADARFQADYLEMALQDQLILTTDQPETYGMRSLFFSALCPELLFQPDEDLGPQRRRELNGEFRYHFLGIHKALGHRALNHDVRAACAVALAPLVYEPDIRAEVLEELRDPGVRWNLREEIARTLWGPATECEPVWQACLEYLGQAPPRLVEAMLGMITSPGGWQRWLATWTEEGP